MGSILGGQTPSKGSATPKWAQGPLGYFTGAPGATSPNGMPALGMGGPYGDAAGGFGSVSPQQLFGGLGNLPGLASQIGQYFGGAGQQVGSQAAGLNQILGQFGMGQAGQSNGLASMLPQFLQQSQPFMQQAGNLATGDPRALMSQFGIGSGGGAPSAFSGGVSGAALGQMGSMDPNGALYNRAMALLKPQVRAGYADRGMAGSGSAIQGENQQAQQLADTLTQQSAQNKIGLLNAGAAGEGANASMTGALGQWNLGQGQQGASLYNSMLQGALGGAQAPGSIFSQFQGGAGTGLANLGAAGALNNLPLASLLQGQNLSMQGLQMPGAISSQIYGDTRAPYLQLLQAAAGAAPLDKGQGYMGLFGIPGKA